MNAHTEIWVRFTLPGLHKWAAATPNRKYLAAAHRHVFFFEVGLEVLHHDREVEFHDLQEFALTCVKGLAVGEVGGILDFGARSCEALAHGIGAILASRYRRDCCVAVWEDNECGARVTTRFTEAEL